MEAKDREGGHDRGVRIDCVGVVRAAGLSDCGILICDLASPICVKWADRVTGVDRLESEDAFEGTDRVMTFAGVNVEDELAEDGATEVRER